MSAAAPGAFYHSGAAVAKRLPRRRGPVTSTHFLPVAPAVFRDIAQERQHAVCLPKEESVMVGDQLVLREQKLAAGRLVFTGEWQMRKVTSVIDGSGIDAGFAVYSFNRSAENERAIVIVKRQLGLAEAQGVSTERYFRHQDKRERARRAKLRASMERVARVREASRRELTAGEASSEAAS